MSVPSGSGNCSHFVRNVVSKAEYYDYTERLIEEVRKCPWLYAMKRQDYNDVQRKQSTWLAISRVVNSSPEDCIQKWKYLRERYTKELRLSRPKMGKTGVVFKESKWPMMKNMAFLRSHIRKRATFGPRLASFGKTTFESRLTSVFPDSQNGNGQGSDADPHNNSGEDTTADPAGDKWQLPDHNESLPTARRTSPTPSDSLSGSESSRCTTKANENGPKSSGFEAELVNALKESRTLRPITPSTSERQVRGDAEYHFAMYVAQRMRTLSGDKKSKLQAKIVEMLHCDEYEVGVSNNLL